MKGLVLDKFLSTFRETSFDKTNGVSLIGECKKKVINFDALTSFICKEYRSGDNLSSTDALALSGDRVLLIEFKNQDYSSLNPRVLQKKAFDTPYIFSFLDGMENVKWNTFSSKMIYIILYRSDDIPSWGKFSSLLENLSQEKTLPFGLGKYKTFYSDIILMKAEEFIKSDLFKNIK